MHSTWDSYIVEILMVAGLLVYALNYTIGKSKNSLLASSWYKAHKEILEANFEVVGKELLACVTRARQFLGGLVQTLFTDVFAMQQWLLCHYF